MEHNKKQRILIITRKHPPSIGGMQLYSRDFIRHMEGIYHVDKIVLGKEQINLVWFLPYLFARSMFLLMTRRYDLVYLCDGLLAPVGIVLKKIFEIKVAITVHGLDITYNHFFYQSFVPIAVAGLDKVVCVSTNTMEECVKRGISREKCVLITNGIDPDEYKLGQDEMNPDSHLDDFMKDKKVLITVGRLIKRKGVSWFVKNVMTKLEKDYVYLVVGSGPEEKNISDVIVECGMEKRVMLTGQVDSETLKFLYNFSDILVLPNQRIHQDPEGFGIVAIEASGCGLPAVANPVDGVSEAVLDGRTGWLIEYNDVNRFIEKIKNPDLDRETVRNNSECFYWSNIFKQYQRVIDEI